jgi:hypothetical protein
VPGTLYKLFNAEGKCIYVFPHGEPDRATSWHELAQRCRDAKTGAA